METMVNIGGERDFRLGHAVLVFTDGQQSYATVHQPQPAPRGGAPVLGPGTPVSTAFIRALSDSLGQTIPLEVLPGEVLVRTPEVVVWWRPRSVAPVFFNTERSKALAGLPQVHGRMVAHPALVFRASGPNLWVRALRDNERPTASTLLYEAPYFNVSGTGSVCVGSMRKPRTGGIDQIAQWERAFFESEFTHQLPGTRLTSWKGGFVKLWQHVATQTRRRRTTPFPVRALVAAQGKQTLAGFVRTDDRGRW